MPTYFQKPENALKRAKEFIEVGKPDQALDVLYDVIKSKRHRMWQKIHEPIMLLYLELCVDLKKSHLAKEGLYQYKNICQNVNVKSLDVVVRKYLEMAGQRTEAARAESQQTVDDVDDLDIIQSPESLLLAAVTAEDAQDRSDRAILTPWVKFLWESFRQCLDLLRNNNRVEKLYHDIAKQAFEFCMQYARKTEFRKLCDNLRTHLKQIVEKTYTQQNAVSLNNADSLSLHLETRLSQLDSSISMELWQEAYKAVEDIHDLIIRSKKVPKPSLLANYFENVSLVFLKSGNRLFHAAACHRLFFLVAEHKKNPSPEEITKMANRVVCATLAIPLPPTRFSIDQLLESNESEKRRRLASLLNLPAPPTRASLVKDLVKNNILQHVSPELKSLYPSLEGDFDPLNLSKKMCGCMEFAKSRDELMKYMAPLQDITVVRLVKQVAQIYQTIEFSRLRQLVPFVSAFELERVVVQAAKNIDLPVRLDHRNQTVSFGIDLNMSGQDDSEGGPFLQHMPGDQLKNQLQLMARALTVAMEKLNIDEQAKTSNLDMKLKIIDTYRKTEKRERDRILKRREVIEKRKEDLEQTNREKDELEMEREREKQKKIREAEEERLKREAAERERQRVQQEHENIRKKEAEKRIEQLKSTDVGIRALEGLTEEELRELDTDEILQKQVEQLEKEKRELQERLKSQEKKIDYFIRAKRIEEIPLLEEHAKELAIKNREKWEHQEHERIEGLKKERELAMKHRDRLRRMLPDKEVFISQLKDARQGDYLEKLDKYNKLLAEKKAERLTERRDARKAERRAEAIRLKEERKQRERDEALRKEREERIKKEQEEQEQRRKEDQERIAKLEEIAAKQRRKEAEVEEKLKRESQNTGPYQSRQGVSSGGWRAREAAKHEEWKRKDNRDEQDGPPQSVHSEGGWRGRSDNHPEMSDRRDRDGDRGWRRDGPRDDRGWDRNRDMGGRGPPRDDFNRDRDHDRPRYDRGFGGPRDGDDKWSRGVNKGFERRDGEREDFRRGGGSRDFGGPRDDPRGGPDQWRRGDGFDRDSGRRGMGGPPRERDRDMGRTGADDNWRKGPSQRSDERNKGSADSDGWSTVRYK